MDEYSGNFQILFLSKKRIKIKTLHVQQILSLQIKKIIIIIIIIQKSSLIYFYVFSSSFFFFFSYHGCHSLSIKTI